MLPLKNNLFHTSGGRFLRPAPGRQLVVTGLSPQNRGASPTQKLGSQSSTGPPPWPRGGVIHPSPLAAPRQRCHQLVTRLFFKKTQDSLKHLACRGFPLSSKLARRPAGCSQTARHCSGGGQLSPQALPPWPAPGRTDGRTGEAGGLAWRALCSCRLCWWACRKGSLSESASCCGPGLGDQQLCPLGRMPRGHQGTRGEADGDLKGPPWGGGHPGGNTCEQAG